MCLPFAGSVTKLKLLGPEDLMDKEGSAAAESPNDMLTVDEVCEIMKWDRRTL
jgi:hypothetical protein